MTDSSLNPTSAQPLTVRLENIGLVGLALIHLLFGLWVIADPLVLATYVDLKPVGPQAGSELRAMYGGLIIGFGAIQWRGYRSMAFAAQPSKPRDRSCRRCAGASSRLLDGALAGLQPVFCSAKSALPACRFAVMHCTRPSNS